MVVTLNKEKDEIKRNGIYIFTFKTPCTEWVSNEGQELYLQSYFASNFYTVLKLWKSSKCEECEVNRSFFALVLFL